eukprot:3267312-Amphidinium_carterae.3
MGKRGSRVAHAAAEQPTTTQGTTCGSPQRAARNQLFKWLAETRHYCHNARISEDCTIEQTTENNANHSKLRVRSLRQIHGSMIQTSRTFFLKTWV